MDAKMDVKMTYVKVMSSPDYVTPKPCVNATTCNMSTPLLATLIKTHSLVVRALSVPNT